MADAGGGVFLFIIFLLSGTIHLIWIFKGKGELRWRLKFTGIYLALTIIPILILFQFLDGKGNPIIVSNTIFVLGLIALFYGFIIPPLSKRFGSDENT